MFGENVLDHDWPEAVGPMGPYGGFGPTIMAIAWMEFALATALILLRIITRYRIQKHAGWALSWTCASWTIGIISQVIFTVAVYKSINGFSNSWTVPTALTYTWVAIYLTFIAIGVGKFAVIAFIFSLQGTTHYRSRIFLYFLGLSNILWDVIYVLFLAFRCAPIGNQYVLHAPLQCSSSFAVTRNLGYFVGSWNAATDFILAVYPLWLFYKIQIAPHVKWGITFVMSLGIVACAVACTKTWDLMYVADTDKLTYELYCILTWSYTEMWVVLITCSVPPLWPLAKRALAGSRASLQGAKAWVSGSSQSETQSGGGWSKVRPSRRNTVTLLGQGHNRTMSSSARAYGSRGRSDSAEKDYELLKHPQAMARSASRAGRDRGRQTPDVRDANNSHSRGKSVASKVTSKGFTDSASLHDDSDAYEVYEPERGIMMGRDVARPGIVVTKEYTVETERRKEDRRTDDWKPADFGNGRTMRHNWDDPNNV